MLENNHTIHLTLNGESRAFTVEPQETLLHVPVSYTHLVADFYPQGVRGIRKAAKLPTAAQDCRAQRVSSRRRGTERSENASKGRPWPDFCVVHKLFTLPPIDNGKCRWYLSLIHISLTVTTS